MAGSGHRRRSIPACVALAVVLTALAAPTAASATLYAYVATEALGVAVVDLDHRSVTGLPFDANTSTTGLTLSADGGRVYAAVQLPAAIVAIDTATRTVVDTIPVGVFAFDVAVTPDGTRAYACDSYSISQGLSVVDLGCRREIRGIAVEGPTRALAANPDGRTVYAASGAGLVAIDVATGKATPIGTVSGAVAAEGLAVTPDGTTAVVSGSPYDQVTILDLRTGVVAANLPVASRPRSVAIAPDGTRAYVLTGIDGVTVIDIVRRRQIATFPVACANFYGCGADSIAISPDGRRLYVTGPESDTLFVLDAATGAALDSIAVGPRPHHVVVVEPPDSPPPTPPCLPTPTATPLPLPIPCVADCNHDTQIGVSEIVLSVNIALGNSRLRLCPDADANGNRRVTIDELLGAVNAALNGCDPLALR